MKIVLFGMGLILATSAQAAKLTYTWDKKEFEALKGKEVYSFYCTPKTGGFTKEVCDRVSKSASFKKFKFKALEWVDNTTIRVGDGPRTVEIKRGARPGSFSMNGKIFDFGKQKGPEIRDAIGAALPRVARTSIFINAAYAEERGDVVVELRDAVNLITAEASNEDQCKAAQQIADLCLDPGSLVPGGENLASAMKNYFGQTTSSGHANAAKKAISAVDTFRNRIVESRELISQGHDLQREGCHVDYDKMRLQTEDAFHLCNGHLENFLVDFDKTVFLNTMNDAVARTTHKKLSLKFTEVVKMMENFYERKMSPGEKDKIMETLAPVQ